MGERKKGGRRSNRIKMSRRKEGGMRYIKGGGKERKRKNEFHTEERKKEGRWRKRHRRGNKIKIK